MRNDEQSSKRDRIEAALLRDHRRRNRDVAREAGASPNHTGKVRREMERARRIPVYRATAAPPIRPRPAYHRAVAELLLDASRSNVDIGKAAQCSGAVVAQARQALLREGRIVRRTRAGYVQAIREQWPTWTGQQKELAHRIGCSPELVSVTVRRMADEQRLHAILKRDRTHE